jgi:hypothetical protein
MKQKFLVEELRKIQDNLKKINEAEIPDSEDADANDTSSNIKDTATDAKADATVTDMMTHEKTPDKLQGSVAVKNLASLLGIENIQLFTNSFNTLRTGKIPSNQAQVRELAIAFYKLLAADASVTSKVLSQLRRIHKAS